MNGGDFYPRSFRAFGWWGGLGTDWLVFLPRNGVVYWQDGVSIHDEAYDPLDPVLMLREIYDWQDRCRGGAP